MTTENTPADPLNGREYGKVYGNNGRNPRLPDGVLVRIKTADGWMPYRRMANRVGWMYVKRFKIVDPRFKPKGMRYH